jgi:hypothetical protein
MRKSIAMALAVFFYAAPTLASEGKVLINQARAEAGSVTAGDAAGFPISINVSGSYKLMSNLVPPNGNVNVIEINANNVILDMNDFVIQGGGTCTLDVVNLWVTSCTNTGTGNGIVSNYSNIAIINGSIQGMGTLGVDMDSALASGYRLENISVLSNGGGGVSFSNNAFLIDVIVGFNDGVGITTALVSRIRHTASGSNGGHGFSLAGSAQIRESGSGNNNGDGFSVGDFSLIRGVRSVGNAAHGIDIGLASTVHESMSSGNGAYGISLGTPGQTPVGYGGNSFIGNTLGPILGSGIQMGTNICNAVACL